MSIITIESGALPAHITPDHLEHMPFREMVRTVHDHGAEFEGFHVRKRQPDPENVIVPDQWRNGGLI